MFKSAHRLPIIRLPREHLSLILIQTAVALPNVMVNAFVLVFFYRNGLSVEFSASFILIEALVALAIVLFSSRFLIRNSELSMILALCFLGVYYIILAIVPTPFVAVAAPFFGLYMVFFWVPYRTMIMSLMDENHRGMGTALYFMIFPLVATVGPVVGGLWITSLGYETLFGLSAFSIFVMAVVVCVTRIFSIERLKLEMEDLIKTLKLSTHGLVHVDMDIAPMSGGLRVALFSEGVQEGIFWVAVPLVGIYYVVYESNLGALFSVFAFAGAISAIFGGMVSDTLRKRFGLARFGALFASIFCLFAIVYPKSATMFGVALGMTYLTLPLVSIFLFLETTDAFAAQKKRGILIRELFINSGRILGTVACLWLALTGLNFRFAFVIAAIALLIIVLVPDEKSKNKHDKSKPENGVET